MRLGSIKSNIGHTQAAAGVAGTIKMVEAMRRGTLPKSLHLDAPSSKVDWEAGKVELLTEQLPWEPNGKPRRAGVSSFGISGTNAHVILEEAPEQVPAGSRETGDRPGASSKQPLAGPAPPRPLGKERARTARGRGAPLCPPQSQPRPGPRRRRLLPATTRSSFEHRAVALGADREELLASLGDLVDGKESKTLAKGRAGKAERPTFLFPGQGSQASGMARGLLDSSPAFAAPMREAEQKHSPPMWSGP